MDLRTSSVRRGRRVVVSSVLGLLAFGCHGRTDDLVTSAGAAPTVTVASAAITQVAQAAPPPAAPSKAACNPVDPAKIEPFELDTRKVKLPVPAIVDEQHALAPFYDRMLALARGQAGEHVRIAMYGDSNLTGDALTGHMRRLLQGRYGDGGHGFVALALPWAWYRHEDVHHNGTWPQWKQIAVTTDPVPDKQYGLNHFAAQSSTPGAAAWVGTADAGAKVGLTTSHVELFFLKQKLGGSFDVLVDGKVAKTVNTKADAYGPGYETLDLPDAPHQVKCVVKGDGKVRLFGAALERGQGAIQVDSLGAGSLNFQRMLMVDNDLRNDNLRHRKHDLVVVWLGMNSMWLPPNRQWVKDVITELRTARPGIPILIVTPPDSVKEGEKKSDPRIVKLGKQLREVSKETGVAFWDMREAMGGSESFLFWMSHRLASPDRHHLLKEGAQLMGERILSALYTGMKDHLASHPNAGCR